MVKKKKEEIVDVICNKCKSSLIPKQVRDAGWPIEGSVYGLNEITYSGGYFSDTTHGVIEDTETYTFSLCEKCLAILFKSFKIKPTTKNYM